MSEAEKASREGGIGARLQAARTRRGLTPGQAAERLHVDPMVIDALEGERFGTLGASVYVRGHLRRYAELLGEPAEELQQLYARSSHAGAVPDLTQIAQVERAPADRRRFYMPGVAVLVAFGIAGAVWWVVTDLRVPRKPSQSGSTAAPPAPALASAAAPLAATNAATTAATDAAAPGAASSSPVAGMPAGAPGSVSTSEPGAASSATDAVVSGAATTAATSPAATAPAAVVPTTAAVPVAALPGAAAPVATAPVPADPAMLDTLSPDARMGAAPSAPAPGVATSAAAKPGAIAATPAAAPASTVPTKAPGEAAAKPRDVRLTLRMSADSWVEVYDAAGKRLYYDVAAADGVQRLAGAGPLRVVLGNPPGVALEVNGRAVTLPAGLRRAETVQFVVEPSGRLVRTRGGADGG